MERNQRFKDADWINTLSSSEVLIGGVGGIGSWLSLYLGRAGIGTLVLVDMDDVTVQNLGGQFFANSQIDRNKALAVRDLLSNFCNHNLNVLHSREPINRSILDSIRPPNAFFACFDNMAARETMYYMWEETLKTSPDSIFIDGRMLAEGFQIAVVTNDPIRKQIYEQNFMQSDAEIPDLPCTLRATSHAASMLAATMFGIFTNHCANIEAGIEYRDIPMFYEFDIPMMNNSLLFPDDYNIEPPAVTQPQGALPKELAGFSLVEGGADDITSTPLVDSFERWLHGS